jgi:uncharacterized OB-fold protein
MMVTTFVGVFPPLEVSAATIIDEPSFTSHDDKEVVEADNKVTITWKKVSNATKYTYAIKRLNSEPDRSDNEAGTTLKNTTTTSTSVTISASEFKAGYWYKIAVQANTIKIGYVDSSWSYLYIYAKAADVIIATPTITSPADNATLEAGQKVTIKWNSVTNATGYVYTIKRLNGTPSGGDNESGTVLANTTTTSTSTTYNTLQ